MTTLAEIRVEERDNCVALIVRTTRALMPWDVWVIVENRPRGDEDLTYGARGFRAIRGLREFYVEDVTYWARKVGYRRREESARRAATRALAKFLKWRDRQRQIAAEIAARESASRGQPPSTGSETSRGAR